MSIEDEIRRLKAQKEQKEADHAQLLRDKWSERIAFLNRRARHVLAPYVHAIKQSGFTKVFDDLIRSVKDGSYETAFEVKYSGEVVGSVYFKSLNLDGGFHESPELKNANDLSVRKLLAVDPDVFKVETARLKFKWNPHRAVHETQQGQHTYTEHDEIYVSFLYDAQKRCFTATVRRAKDEGVQSVDLPVKNKKKLEEIVARAYTGSF